MQTEIEATDAASTSARILPGRDWLALTKPGIVLSNVLMTAVGLAFAPTVGASIVVATLAGTALLIAACGALNMVLEEGPDQLMERTANRPVAAGRITRMAAAAFGVSLFGLGVLMLLTFTTVWATVFGIIATVIYVAIYTPMKRWTWWAVPVGAVAGALPPVIGWFAAGGSWHPLPALLFATIAIWQLPHFMAIGVRRWEDYERAGLKIATPPERFQRAIFGIRMTSLALVPLTVAVAIVAQAGFLFWTLSSLAAIYLLAAAMRRTDDPSRWAKKVFLSSLAYLPLFALGSFLS